MFPRGGIPRTMLGYSLYQRLVLPVPRFGIASTNGWYLVYHPLVVGLCQGLSPLEEQAFISVLDVGIDITAFFPCGQDCTDSDVLETDR